MNPTFNGYRMAEAEQEWEVQEASHHASSFREGEWEAENEYSWPSILSSLQKTARGTVPTAQQMAPIAAKMLAGSIRSPVAQNLINSWLREGEAIATSMEAEAFGNQELEAEVSNSEMAYESALAEVLAAEASHSNSESEAEAFLGAALPSMVSSMGGSRALRSVMPTLVQANAQLVRLLHQRGAAGQRLMRLIPTVLRRTIASLRAAYRSGRKVDAGVARQIFATHTKQVLSNPKLVTSGIIRNALIQKRTTRSV
ncbi:MAG: hypothetical protein HC860_06425 [Alkalinema sp. RU_4_3]|nr:hypothetical protein [Alkalinema sp. RU_4_3]